MKRTVLVGNFFRDEMLLQVLAERNLCEDLAMYQLVEPKRGGLYARKLDPKLKDADVEEAITAADVLIAIGDMGNLVKRKAEGKTIIQIRDYAPLETASVPYMVVRYSPEWFPDVIRIIRDISLAGYDFRLASPQQWLDDILSLTKLRNSDAGVEIKLICENGYTPRLENIRSKCIDFLRDNTSYPKYCTQLLYLYQSRWKKNIHILKCIQKDTSGKELMVFLSCSRTLRKLSGIQKNIFNALVSGDIAKLFTFPKREIEEVVSFLTYEYIEGERFEALSGSGLAVIANKNDIIVSFLGSRRCNMKCKYCFSDHTCEAKSTMTNKMVLEIIEMLCSEQDKLNLHIDNNLGGEPLLDFNAVMLRHNAAIALHKTHGTYATFGLLTNGTLLQDGYLDWLKSHLPYVGFSLDGDKETHDKIRTDVSGDPTYERTVSGMKLLRQAGWPVDTGVSAVISKYNMDITQLQKHIREELNVPNIVMKPVRAAEESDFALTYNDLDGLKRGYGTFFTYLLDEGREGNLKPLFAMLQPLDYAGRFLIRTFLADRVIVKRCGSGEHIFSVSDSGSVYPCDSFNGIEGMEIGNVDEGMHNRPNYCVPFVNDENPLFGCDICWARYLCGGICNYVKHLNNYAHNDVTKMECGLAKFLIESSICFWKEARETWSEESLAEVKNRIRRIGITEYDDKNSFVYAPC